MSTRREYCKIFLLQFRMCMKNVLIISIMAPAKKYCESWFGNSYKLKLLLDNFLWMTKICMNMQYASMLPLNDKTPTCRKKFKFFCINLRACVKHNNIFIISCGVTELFERFCLILFLNTFSFLRCCYKSVQLTVSNCSYLQKNFKHKKKAAYLKIKGCILNFLNKVSNMMYSPVYINQSGYNVFAKTWQVSFTGTLTFPHVYIFV